MMQGLYTAATGLSNQQKRVDTIANNIANINTTGFKKTRVDFKDALYTTMQNPTGEQTNLQKGSGVMIGATTIDYSGGNIVTTENNLDFALQGEGFFALRNAQGEEVYTRNGSFNQSADGYLVSANGDYVLDQKNNRIRFTGEGEITVSSNGIVSQGDTAIGAIKVVDFENKNGLLPVGDSCFAVSVASGQPENVTDYTVRQGAVEGSNVNLAQELTLLIRTQRAYTMASKALQTADDMDGLANSIRK